MLVADMVISQFSDFTGPQAVELVTLIHQKQSNRPQASTELFGLTATVKILYSKSVYPSVY